MDTERTNEPTQEEPEGGSRAGDPSPGEGARSAAQAEERPGKAHGHSKDMDPSGDDRPIIISPGDGGGNS